MSTDLEIRVTAQMAEIKAALAGLRTDIASVGRTATSSAAGGKALTGSLAQARVQARAVAVESTGMQRAISGAVGQAKLLVAGIGIAGFVSALIHAADTSTRLTGQLKLVTNGTRELTRAQQETFAIAQRTRQGLEATVGLYARIARAGKTTQEQTLALTESINQAVSLSFTTAEAGQAALFQLGQGLGSGVLRGEELNSVLEQTPRLAQAIAEGLVKLGQIKDPGGLRAYAQKNGIAASQVVAAIATQQQKLREEFAKLQPTVADAVTGLKNEFIKLVGEENTASGATRSLADAIKTVADNLRLIAGLAITGAKIWGAYFLAFKAGPVLIDFLAAAVARVTIRLALLSPAMRLAAAQATAVGVNSGRAAIGVNTLSGSFIRARLAALGVVGVMTGALSLAFAAFAGWEIGTELADQFLKVKLAGIALAQGIHKAIVIVGQSFQITGAVMKAAWGEAFNWIKAKSADMLDTIAAAYGKLPSLIGGSVANLAKGASSSIRASISQTESVGDAYKRMSATATAELAKIDQGYSDLADAAIDAENAKNKVTNAPPGATGGGAGGTGAGKAIHGIVDQLALLKDAAERALRELEQLYEDGKISVTEYYRQKTKLQQESIDADIAAAQRDARNAKSSSERSQALTQIIILERARRDVALQSAHDQVKAEEDLIDQLGAVKAKLLELQGDTAGARKIELEAEYKDLLVRLDRDADTAGKALVRKLINVEAAKAGLDQLKTEFSNTTGALSQLEQTTAAQVDAGMLSHATGEKRIADARTQAIAQLEKQRAAVAALYDAYKDPEVLLQLQAIDGEIAQLSISTDDWRGKVEDAAISSLSTFFYDIATGAKTAKEAVRDLAVGFVQSLAQMAAQALAKKAIEGIMDAFSGAKKDKGGGKGMVTEVATAAAAGLAYATPVELAAGALGVAGGTVSAAAVALGISAEALQAAATTLLIANAASVAHSGGVVGSLGSIRSVSPMAFLGAPRYHSGGVAGLAANEVPAILQRGEEVITKTDSRHRYNGGLNRAQTQQPGNRFIFVDDHRKVADYLNSPEGERVFVQTIGRNATAVREILSR